MIPVRQMHEARQAPMAGTAGTAGVVNTAGTAGLVQVQQAVLSRREVRCVPADDHALVREHYRIRQAVFVDEQGVFEGTDQDPYDLVPGVVHVVAMLDGVPAGTVRFFPLHRPSGLWQGDRLAVLPEFRVHGVGGPLVRYAVAQSGLCGGLQMVAHIQLPNVRFFQRLGWSTDGEVEDYLGVAHQPMRIDLTRPS